MDADEAKRIIQHEHIVAENALQRAESADAKLRELGELAERLESYAAGHMAEPAYVRGMVSSYDETARAIRKILQGGET